MPAKSDLTLIPANTTRNQRKVLLREHVPRNTEAHRHHSSHNINDILSTEKKLAFEIDIAYICYTMRERLLKIDAKIERIKSELMKVKTMRPGLVSRQYKNRKEKTGAYYQISYTYRMHSRTEYIPVGMVIDVRRQTAEYGRFKKLIDAWIGLSMEHSRLINKIEKERSNSPMKRTRSEISTIQRREITYRVTLCDTNPPVWRMLKMFSDMSLDQLHYAIQGAFGWENSHLHAFETRGKMRYSSNEINIDEGDEKDSRRVTLAKLLEKNITKFTYEYDFGDSWNHEIEVENIALTETKTSVPECIDGARHCPPEDCGGTAGFENFREAMANPKHPEHRELKEWFGGRFDPEKFSKKAANEGIQSFLKYAGQGAEHP